MKISCSLIHFGSLFSHFRNVTVDYCCRHQDDDDDDDDSDVFNRVTIELKHSTAGGRAGVKGMSVARVSCVTCEWVPEAFGNIGIKRKEGKSRYCRRPPPTVFSPTVLLDVCTCVFENILTKQM